MLRSLQDLFRHRALLRALTLREVRARYRGSVLGFLWSFLNPLLLLLVYTFVFQYVFAPRAGAGPEPYAVYLFTGILPWTWFSAALLEAASSVVYGGSLLRKVVFPAEVLPLVSVLANAVHFLVALPVLLAVLALSGHPPGLAALWTVPVFLIQLVFVTGLALGAAALCVLFRDVRDLLNHLIMLWFFATPVIYELASVPEGFRPYLRLNPMTQVIRGWQDALFYGHAPSARGLLAAAAVAVVTAALGYAFFDRLREVFPEEV